jgi:phosphatidate cytidylyltransferase
MNNLTKRVLLIFTVIPVLFASLFLLTFAHHIVAHIISTALMIVGSKEMWHILTADQDIDENIMVLLIPLIISIVNYLECAQIAAGGTLSIAAGILIFIIFAHQILARENQFEHINRNIQALMILVFYPGFFFAYATKLTTLPHPAWTLVGFLVMVFCNDIFAYVFGMLFGKSTRNIFPVSPKKSLAGFIGGFIFSIVGAVVIYYMGAPIFGGSLFKAIIISCIIGIVAPAGDLIESAMKRSSHIKDSGNYIPGRGGIMDNIDSLIFSAPIYYYLIIYLCLA